MGAGPEDFLQLLEILLNEGAGGMQNHVRSGLGEAGAGIAGNAKRRRFRVLQEFFQAATRFERIDIDDASQFKKGFLQDQFDDFTADMSQSKLNHSNAGVFAVHEYLRFIFFSGACKKKTSLPSPGWGYT
jgi:hypothetical protein